MADPSPLLTTTPTPTTTTIDDTIEQCVGPTGLPQLLLAILISSAWAFDAQQVFISVFTDSKPTWHCTDPHDTACSSSTTPCGLREGSWAWDRPKYATIVSEWGLECSASSGFPASAFFAGCLVGGFVLATLADSRFGRKKMLWSSCMGMAVVVMATAFSPNLWVYAALRFITGFFRATIGTSALVLSAEITTKRWRSQMTVAGFFLFGFGFLSLPAMAYIGKDSSWRTLYFYTSIPTLLYSISILMFAQESPRWLLVRGRREEAIQTLIKMTSSNGRQLSDSFFDKLEFGEMEGDDDEHDGGINLFSALEILLEAKWAFRRIVAMMIISIGVGMVYYGIPLAVGNLDFNIYLSVTLNALSELPSAVLTFLLVDTLNRRSTLLMTTLTSGLACLACAFTKNGNVMQMPLELVAFFATCTSFNFVLIYTLELFPTCVRNSAVAMVRQAVVLGGVFAPLLVAMGRHDCVSVSHGVFGMVIGCCGLFVICLPETRGEGICDTMEEQGYKETLITEGNPLYVA